MIVVRSRQPHSPTARVSVTAKGQFTIPKRLRDALGLVPGSRAAIELIDHGFIVRRLTHREHATGRATRHRPRREARPV